MAVTYRVMAAHELDVTSLSGWQAIQSKNNIFASPYFCPEFTRLVGTVRDDVRVVMIEDDGRIVGFFPHQRSLFGMGHPVGGPLSDYHGVIAGPDAVWELKPLLRAAKLSAWTFTHLVDNAHKFDSHIQIHTTSPQIDLSSGYAQYVKDRREAGSDYVRKTEGLARKLAREFGELRFSFHDSSSETIGQLIKWKSEQYREARLPDAFAVPWTGDLLHRITETQTDKFAGVCSVLRVQDRIVAIHLGMRSARVLHYWFPAYDPEFGKFSPGIILLLRMAEALEAMGIQTIDLGEGTSQYKQRLMTGEVALHKGSVELPSLLATAMQLRRTAETHAAHGGIPAFFRLPLRAIKRIERTLKYR